MNTDSRKAILCVIMSSEDYIDAFEKLLRLDLPGKQDREIMRVLVEYAVYRRKFLTSTTQFSLQSCVCTTRIISLHFRYYSNRLYEAVCAMILFSPIILCFYCNNKPPAVLHMGPFQRTRVNVTSEINPSGEICGRDYCILHNLSLAVFKSVDLAYPVELTAKESFTFECFFEAIFEHPEDLVWNLFTLIALNPDYEALRDGIKFFVKKYVVKTNKAIYVKFRKAKEALNNAEGLLM